MVIIQDYPTIPNLITRSLKVEEGGRGELVKDVIKEASLELLV
jgi:hypothetical protein